MKINNLILFLFFFLFCLSGFAQEEDPMDIIAAEQVKEPEERDYKPYDPLAPARAAFYSAILPGLGQAYNGKYWKIPIVYTGLGIGVYFYLNNDKHYDRYRSAYKSRLAGRMDDEFINEEGDAILSTEGLIEAQEFYQRNKEISIMVIAGIYILNIIDANVDAHLAQFNVNEDLTLKPAFDFDRFSGRTGYKLSLNFKF